MPNLTTIRESIATLPKGPPLVVAITGGTTGIGSYIAAAFARAFSKQGHKLRIYVIGRSTSRAETVLEYGRATSPGSDWRFIQAEDLSLMSDVERISKEIIRQEEEKPFAGGVPRLDALYMSQALSPLQPSKHSISSTTLPIGTPSPQVYGPTSVRTHVAFMKTFLFESLADKYAGKISFVHIYPGLVDGPTFYSDVNPLWFRMLWRVMKPLMGWYMNSPEDCGSREVRGGSYGVGQRGDEMKDKVWEHTMGVLEGIEKKSAVS
ncbi:hypothetical protein FB567DRAFT_450042 [Paraphoma chrysanthemicola]|uniref:NAD(P)-binding protein n=1 Tax=Paraphoma chrysanthemicola TaxID=798071 RepID=A0A8K0R1G5_9PLEO|nr:hypothetical protein FB567DRAFT_450042 [Paraphoma chrysanthemicola]